MPGFKEVLLGGTALTVAGGVAYVVWNVVNTKRREDAESVPLNQHSYKEKHEKLEVNEEEIRSETFKPASSLPQKGQVKGSQVLMLGLEGSGKTSLLNCFAMGSVEQDVSPTQGFNAVSINREELQIEFLEIGGKEKFREYWPMYLNKARVLVFVVDAAEPARFPLAKTCLHHILAPEPHLPLVLLANKQDLPGACGVSELFESLALDSVGDDRKLYILGTQARKGSTSCNPYLQEAYELIIELMKQ